MISLPEKKTFVFIFVKMLMLMWSGEKCHYENDEMSFLGQRKKRRKKMNYCHNLAGGSIDTGEGHVEYFR